MSLNDEFARDINLSGWADQSIWGYNSLLKCYRAALWRDEDHTDAPRIEFSVYYLIPTMALLTRLLADALGLREVEVVRALTTRTAHSAQVAFRRDKLVQVDWWRRTHATTADIAASAADLLVPQRRRTSWTASQTPKTGQRTSRIATSTSRPAHACAAVSMICRPSRSQTIHAATSIGGLAAI